MNNKQALFMITLLAIAFISFIAYLTFPPVELLLIVLKIALIIGIPVAVFGIAVLIYETYQYLGQ